MISLFLTHQMRLDYGHRHVSLFRLSRNCLTLRTDNYPQPGKRPLSSSAPTIIENPDGTLHLVVGGAGGSRIFPGTFQVILNVDWGMDIGQAIEYGRLHDQLYPSALEVENTFPSDLREELRVRGHNITGQSFWRILSIPTDNILISAYHRS